MATHPRCEAHILTPVSLKYRILWSHRAVGTAALTELRRHTVIIGLGSSATLLPAAQPNSDQPFNWGLVLLVQWSLSSPVMGTSFYIQYLLQGVSLLSCSGLMPWVHSPVIYA